jgi:hypothetical protein
MNRGCNCSAMNQQIDKYVSRRMIAFLFEKIIEVNLFDQTKGNI